MQQIVKMNLLADLKKQLEESQKELDDLRVQMSTLESERHNLKLKIAELEYGVTVGCVVVDLEGAEFQVTRVDVRPTRRPWIEGNPKKKDGTWGTAKRNLYDNWQLK